MYQFAGTCPNCGYCPHCGRGRQYGYPYQPPYYPYITYTSGGTAQEGVPTYSGSGSQPADVAQFTQEHRDEIKSLFSKHYPEVLK